jgi:hypothetical protein
MAWGAFCRLSPPALFDALPRTAGRRKAIREIAGASVWPKRRGEETYRCRLCGPQPSAGKKRQQQSKRHGGLPRYDVCARFAPAMCFQSWGPGSLRPWRKRDWRSPGIGPTATVGLLIPFKPPEHHKDEEEREEDSKVQLHTNADVVALSPWFSLAFGRVIKGLM